MPFMSNAAGEPMSLGVPTRYFKALALTTSLDEFKAYCDTMESTSAWGGQCEVASSYSKAFAHT